MKCAAIGGAVAAGALALAPAASAAVTIFDIGSGPGTDNDEYLVLNSNNQQVDDPGFGPRVFFFTAFKCTNDERIGMGFFAKQDDPGEDARGVRGLTRNCSGATQYVGVVVERRPASPQFEADQNEQLDVLGIAATDLNDSINSVTFSDTALNFSETL